jgi:hypothetical protein
LVVRRRTISRGNEAAIKKRRDGAEHRKRFKPDIIRLPCRQPVVRVVKKYAVFLIDWSPAIQIHTARRYASLGHAAIDAGDEGTIERKALISQLSEQNVKCSV